MRASKCDVSHHSGVDRLLKTSGRQCAHFVVARLDHRSIFDCACANRIISFVRLFGRRPQTFDFALTTEEVDVERVPRRDRIDAARRRLAHQRRQQCRHEQQVAQRIADGLTPFAASGRQRGQTHQQLTWWATCDIASRRERADDGGSCARQMTSQNHEQSRLESARTASSRRSSASLKSTVP